MSKKRPMPSSFNKQGQAGGSHHHHHHQMTRRSHSRIELQEKQSLNQLPEELVEHVFEYLTDRVEDLGPLVLVNKLCHACATSPSVVGRLKLRPWERFKRVHEEEGEEAASSQLGEYLRQAAQHFPGISDIELGHEDWADFVTNAHVQMLASFPCLKKLSLMLCREVTDVRPLSSLTSLEELNLECTKINDQSLRAIATSLTRLTKLNLCGCNSITAEGFACLSSLVSLEELNAAFTIIDNEGLRAIATSLTRLTKLNLDGCDSITAEGFACLSSLTALEELDVGYTSIDDERLRVLDSLPSLQELYLQGCNSVSAGAVKSLSVSKVLWS